MLKREGCEVNAKRIYRLFTEEGLIVRTKRRKERAQRQRIAQGPASRPDERWSMDFVAQRLYDRRWIRVLTVVDQYTRECLALHADTALSGEKVAAALDRMVAGRGVPKSITVGGAGNGKSLRQTKNAFCLVSVTKEGGYSANGRTSLLHLLNARKLAGNDSGRSVGRRTRGCVCTCDKWNEQVFRIGESDSHEEARTAPHRWSPAQASQG